MTLANNPRLRDDRKVSPAPCMFPHVCVYVCERVRVLIIVLLVAVGGALGAWSAIAGLGDLAPRADAARLAPRCALHARSTDRSAPPQRMWRQLASPLTPVRASMEQACSFHRSCDRARCGAIRSATRRRRRQRRSCQFGSSSHPAWSRNGEHDSSWVTPSGRTPPGLGPRGTFGSAWAQPPRPPTRWLPRAPLCPSPHEMALTRGGVQSRLGRTTDAPPPSAGPRTCGARRLRRSRVGPRISALLRGAW